MNGIDVSKYKAFPEKEKKVKNIFSFLNKDISFSSGRLNDKKKERYYSELSILLSAGLDIKTALELIVSEQGKIKEKTLFEGIKNQVVAGKSLSAAQQETEKFSAYEFHSIRIGEESGKLNDILTELAKFYAGQIKQKQQMIKSLSYPAVVLLTALGAVFFMMRFVVPMFADIFKRFQGELPYLTKKIIAFSEFFKVYALPGFLLISTVIFLLYSQRKKEIFRKYSAILLLKIPVIGKIVHKIYLARFCHSMNLLISAKTPLVTSLDLVKNMIGFYPMEKALDIIREEVMSGKPLYESLAGFPIFNQRMVSLIKVAEEVNRLEMIFSKLTKQYQDEVEHQSSMMATVLEPIMIILIGGFVAFILIAMYMPLFQISTTFKY